MPKLAIVQGTSAPSQQPGTTRKILLTPKKAAEFLKRNTANRIPSPDHEFELAEEMTAGRYRYTGTQSIVFDFNNVMLNGQTTCGASIRSGVSVWVNLTEGVDPEVMACIDTGRVRPPSTVLSLLNKKHAGILAPALGLVESYHSDELKYGRTKRTPPSRLERLLQHYQGIEESVEYALSVLPPPRKSFITHSVFAALEFLGCGENKAKRELMHQLFFEPLASGTDLRQKEPAYELRELLQCDRGRIRLSNPYVLAISVKAFNAAHDIKEIKCLRWNRGESFPIIPHNPPRDLRPCEPKSAIALVQGAKQTGSRRQRGNRGHGKTGQRKTQS